MTAQQLREWVQQVARDMGKAIFTDPKDNWEPMAFLVAPDGTLTVVALVVEGGGAEQAAALTAVLLEHRSRMMAFLVSAWTLRVSQEELEDNSYQRPSESPDKEEQLVLQVFHPDGVLLSMASIGRHADAPPTLSEWHQPSYGTGRFQELLDLLVVD